MALLDLATLDDALSQMFEARLRAQMNRASVLASILPKKLGSGKNVAFDVEFSGASAASYVDGADASTFDSDISVPATLDWAKHRSNFSVSGLAISAAQSSASPADLLNVIMAKADGCGSKLLSVMNAALYTGAGGSTFVGLETAVDDATSYANISRVTYSEWQASVLANGAVVRDLTKALLDDCERTVYGKCGISPNFIVTTPLIAQRFKNLIDTTVRHEAGKDLGIMAGFGEEIPEALRRNVVGTYEGIPVFRDKDCPAGKLFMLNSEEMSIEVLPQPGVNTAVMSGDKSLVGNEGDRVSGLVARIEALAKNGDADRWSIKSYAQLKCARPNTLAVIEDLPTS